MMAGTKTKARPTTSPPTKGRRVADDITAGMRELEAWMASGEPAGRRFTVRTVAWPDEPGEYGPPAVRATRERLGASQAVFARFLGASPKLVQAWEIGGRKPSPMARRLLDEFNRDPDRWTTVLRPKTGLPAART